MEAYIPLLKRCSLFSVLEEETLRRELLPQGRKRSIPKGKYLLLPQERLDSFGILLKGQIHTMHIFADGSYSIMEAFSAGEVFGADLICTRSRISPYHAVAAEDTTLLFFPCSLLLSPGTLQESTRQQILSRLLTLISNFNMQKEYRLAILSQKGLRDRILTYLSMQASKRHTNSFTIPFSREEMASFLCVNRSALSHELSLMKKEGLIDFRKNKFTVLNRESENFVENKNSSLRRDF